MKIGDKVSVIDENLNGTITSLHGNLVDFKDEFGFVYQYPKEKLVLRNENFYEGISVEKKPEPKVPVSKKNASSKQMVLDLHFDQLVPHPADYGSFERLFIQKEKLLETIDFCRKHKIRRLEIIHGIGDGTLQKLVKDTLKSAGIDFYHKDILPEQSGAVIAEFH